MNDELQVSVHNWRFESGEQIQIKHSKYFPRGYRDGPTRGWYCWAYPTNYDKFEQWMAENCPNADRTPRFNSGDPMWTVYISDESEAAIFQLTWG